MPQYLLVLSSMALQMQVKARYVYAANAPTHALVKRLQDRSHVEWKKYYLNITVHAYLKQCWTPLSFHKRFMMFANSGVNSPSSAALANVKKCRASSWFKIIWLEHKICMTQNISPKRRITYHSNENLSK